MGRHKLADNQKKRKEDNKEKDESEKEDEIKEDMQESKSESTSRPRGRPKKAVTQPNNIQSKPKIFELDQSKEKSSIALHIPLYDDSSSESEISQKNQFTMKDESEDEDEKVFEKKSNVNKLIMYLSDDDSDDDQNVKSLKKKLKKKEDLIKKLKDEIHTKSNDCNDAIYSISQKKTPDVKLLNMKLFNLNKDNKCNIGEKTKIACWWCTYNFDNFPCFIPEKYNDGKFYVFGNFCSYNCALAYILKDDDYKVANRVSLIKRLYSELYETTEPLFPSPPKELLNKFGGPMTLEEYKNEQTKLELKEYKMKFNNILQIPFHFEEINREYNTQRCL